MEHMKPQSKESVRKRAWSIINSVFFCTVIFGIGAAMLVLERPSVSETEKRELTKFPTFSLESYFSGEFAAQLDKYFTDTVPFRDELTELASAINKAKGISAPTFYGNVEIVNDDDTPQYTVITPSTEQAENAETTVPNAVTEITAAPETTESETEEPDVSEFLNNGIIVDGINMYGEKAGIMLFGGNKKQGARYAQLISEYKRQLGDGVNVYNLLVPTSAEFYLPEKYSKYSSSEKDAIDYAYSCLTDGVIPVDAYSVIAEHTDEYLYFRTDHHWTALGAYYAYVAFCNAIGQTAPTLDQYQSITKDELFVGSLYGYTNDITLKNNPDIFTYYLPNVEYSGQDFYYDTLEPSYANPIFHDYASGANMYSLFLGQDKTHVKITTNAGTGRKIVMFKESFGNAFAPFLISSFDEIYVIDIRYFGRNAVEYIKEVGATDVLFIDNIFAANTAKLINGIELMLTSETGTVITTPPETTVTTVPEESLTADETVSDITEVTEEPAEAAEVTVVP
ncbi:MAG: hypothetical protein J6C96_11995 [Oscillospiraceae bacterium]|nr:hypothetical protein [Oscillospiraceae bacterium]